jgi:dTDP-glucose 4,6-dehydratase
VGVEMTKKLLLTGATGFIGSHLAAKLSNYDVTCAIPSSDIGQKNLPTDVEVAFCDITDGAAVKSLIAKMKPEIIVHLAAVSPVRYSFEQPEIYQEVNYLSTINMALAASKVPGFEKFVFASTMESYGWQTVHKPFNENTPQNPASPYSVAKVAAEKYIRMMGLYMGFPHVIMRCCNTFGRKTEKNYFMEHVITSYLAGRLPRIGEPDSIRDYMYVDDHVNAYLKVIEYKMPQSDVSGNMKKDMNYYSFNFGNGLALTNAEHASKIANLMRLALKYEAGYPKDYPYRPVNEPYLSLDAAKAKKVLGWKPTVPIEEGYRKTINYWKKAL